MDEFYEWYVSGRDHSREKVFDGKQKTSRMNKNKAEVT